MYQATLNQPLPVSAWPATKTKIIQEHQLCSFNPQFLRCHPVSVTKKSHVDLPQAASFSITKKKPQSFRDNPLKKAKVKTELCENFVLGRPCEFGSKCSYAHGEHELRLTKLREREYIEDIWTFRTKPCFDWVSTGACPFKNRCKFLHDEKFRGKKKDGAIVESWLLDTQMVDIHLNTDVHVNNLHHLHVCSANQTPFGTLLKLRSEPTNDLSSEWKIAYDKISGVSSSNLYGIDEKVILKVVQRMRHDFGDVYTYQDTHTVLNKMCMIIQCRKFCISSKLTITVHEIAFHPDRVPPTNSPVALFFNLPASVIVPCSHQQMKNRNKIEKQRTKSSISPFSKYLSFPIYHSTDYDVHSLIGSILDHRLKSLQENAKSRKILLMQELDMISKFSSLKRHFEAWAFPSNNGKEMERENIDKNDEVPQVDTIYNIDNKNKLGKNSKVIWDSFCSNLNFKDRKEHNKNRLPIFHKLSDGYSQTITKNAYALEDTIWNTETRNFRQSRLDALPIVSLEKSEKCWKSLLLKNSEHNDWDQVKKNMEEKRVNKNRHQ